MNRRKHSNEFRMEAMRLAECGDVPVARNLGIHESLLHKWMKQFGKRPDGSRLSADEHEELTRLRRELRIGKQERDILEKATAFFIVISRSLGPAYQPPATGTLPYE